MAGALDASVGVVTGGVVVTEDGLHEFVQSTLAATGMLNDDAVLAASVLVDTDLRGIASHGVTLLPRYVEGLRTAAYEPRPSIERVRERTAVVVVDGGGGLGQVVAGRGMELAIDRARDTGLAVVAARNSNHFGAAGYYAEMAANAGMVGWVLTNAPAVMAAWGGAEAVIGNNPLAVGVPRPGHPAIVFDMACSVVAKGLVRMAAERREPIPAGWAVDTDGASTTDPDRALAGAVLPVAQHKGFGLALIGELLAGALPLARCCLEISRDASMGGTHLESWGVGHWLLAADVEAFADLDAYAERVETVVATVKGSTPAEGSSGVRLPGEHEAALRRQRRSDGIPIEAGVARRLEQLGQSLDVAVPW